MLLAFFTRRLRLWLFLAIGAPVLAWGWLDRRTKGPLAHDPDTR